MRTCEASAGPGVPVRWREAQTAQAEYWDGLSIGELLRISAGKPAFWDLADARSLVRNVRPDSILVRAHPHSFLPGTVVKLVRKAGFETPTVRGVPGWGRRLAGSHSRPAFVARKSAESG